MVPRKLAVVLHADVVGSTGLVQRNETLAHERIHDAFQRFTAIIRNYGGIVHEVRGDALVAEFERASDAVSAALAFQADNTEVNAALDDYIQPELRVGIGLGEVVIADRTITGPGVVIAQRLEQLSDAAGVCIQGAAYETIPQRLPFEYRNLGEREIKGFDDAFKVYAVSLRPGETRPPPEPLARQSLVAWKPAAAIVATLLVLVAGGLSWWQPRDTELETGSPERMADLPSDKPSIAVLPFDNLSDNPENEYLSDGLTNDIITDLSKFRQVFVISGNSTFTYKGKATKAQQVAEDLGVRYVLEGSLQMSGDRLRINAQLIDATTGHHLWAERYDRDANEFFAIQEDILRTIVSSLAREITKAEFDRAVGKPTSELQAYDYYQRARKIYQLYTREANNEALELVEKAIELDPGYANAYGLAAWMHVNNSSGRYSWGDDPERSLQLALDLAKKSVDLDPDDYYNQWALGFAQTFHGNYEQARAAYSRALSLNPNDATLLANMVEFLWKTGNAEQAVDQMKLAMRINPLHPDWYFWDLGLAQYFAGQYEEALASLNRMPKPPNGSRRALAAVLVRLDRVDEAREVISEFVATDLDMTLEEMEAFAWKDREGLQRWIDDLRTAGLPETRPGRSGG